MSCFRTPSIRSFEARRMFYRAPVRRVPHCIGWRGRVRIVVESAFLVYWHPFEICFVALNEVDMGLPLVLTPRWCRHLLQVI